MLVVAALAVAAVVGWVVSGRGTSPAAGPLAPSVGRQVATASAPVSPSATSAGAVPLGFTRCEEVPAGFCTAIPQCWGGLVIIGGMSISARPVACDQAHYYETYAGGWLPADLVGAPLETIRSRSEVAAVCTASVLRGALRQSATVRKWQQEVLPQQVRGRNEWVFHCVAARAIGGEVVGSSFAQR